jgi:hypothetical protein
MNRKGPEDYKEWQNKRRIRPEKLPQLRFAISSASLPAPRTIPSLRSSRFP